MRSLKSRKQFKHRKRQSSKKRMKNKKRKLSKRLRGGMNISNMSTQTIYNKMKEAIKKDKEGKLKFSEMDSEILAKFIKDGDALVKEANFRQKQTPKEYKQIRSKFYTLLDTAEGHLPIKKKIENI